MANRYNRLRVAVEIPQEIYDWLKEEAYKESNIITVKMNEILRIAYEEAEANGDRKR